MQLEDYEKEDLELAETIPELDILQGHEFGISAIQIAFRIGFNRGCRIKDLAIELGLIKQGSNPWSYKLKEQ